MKKIFLSVIAVATALAFTSCSDSDLDSTNYTEANSETYNGSTSALTHQLSALYGVMNQYANDPLQTPWFVNIIMSDDCNGAGGTGDVECHAIGHLMSNKDALFDTAWKSTYAGISRANAIIGHIDDGTWSDMDAHDQMLGEAYFMRGLMYLWGSQFWGDIPAYWTTAAPDSCYTQDAETVIYPHIISDFLAAAHLMKHGATTVGDGHATKGAAEGFLARAYMFYEGFYKKAGELAKADPASVDLIQQNGIYTVKDDQGNEKVQPFTKDSVVYYLKDAVAHGGYSLVDDFRRLWQYTNEYSIKDYAYTADLQNADGSWRTWAGNGNPEEVFQVQFGNMASWNGTIGMGFTNMTSLYSGLRCDDNGAGVSNGTKLSIPFGQGWGQGTITTCLYDEWNSADKRKKATILDAPTELGLNSGFVFTTSCTEDAGYYNKKLVPVTCSQSNFDDNTVAYTWWGVLRNSKNITNTNGNSFQGDHFADIYLMRYSDILLMLTELTGEKEWMNQVQARAGVDQTEYSWKNIKDERRWEFAGEGLRFNDLRRWSGKNGGASCEAAVALQKQDGQSVYYTGKKATMHHAVSSWSQRYAETDGFLRIPPEQIQIINNSKILKQNKGWGNDVSDWNMTGTPVYN